MFQIRKLLELVIPKVKPSRKYIMNSNEQIDTNNIDFHKEFDRMNEVIKAISRAIKNEKRSNG